MRFNLQSALIVSALLGSLNLHATAAPVGSIALSQVGALGDPKFSKITRKITLGSAERKSKDRTPNFFGRPVTGKY